MASLSTAKVSAVTSIVILFYISRPLFWKISATVYDIRHNNRTVRQGISQLVYAARRSVRWCHEESDSEIFMDWLQPSGSSAFRRLLDTFE